MFAEFLTQNEFFDKYIQLFTTRFTIGNLEMEDPKTEITNPARAVEMYGNMNAFLKLIKSNPEKITPYDLIDISDIVNNKMFARGFRKTQVDVKMAKNFFPISPREVPSAVYSLFDTYHNVWDKLEVYEREARLHLELVRIQPFEDGNKRTTRILTNFNLCKNNKAPIVINGDQTEEYFRCIDEYDIKSLTEMFRKNSMEEFNVMINLYKNICGDEIIKEENTAKENVNLPSIINALENENISSSKSSMNSTQILKLNKMLSKEDREKMFL